MAADSRRLEPQNICQTGQQGACDTDQGYFREHFGWSYFGNAFLFCSHFTSDGRRNGHSPQDA